MKGEEVNDVLHHAVIGSERDEFGGRYSEIHLQYHEPL